MKIFGDKNPSRLTYVKEPGFFFGSNDVLKGFKRVVSYTINTSVFRGTYSKTIKPKLYLHISENAWTTFTGKLREYFLPWRWKTAYLDLENGTQPRQILVCGTGLSDRLKLLLGRSLFLMNLINSNHYDEVFGQEFIRLPGENRRGKTKIAHPLGEWIVSHVKFSNDLFCHIYRSRSLFSRFKYNLLKQFSSSWKEVAIQAGQISEKILIKKSDEEAISRSGLIV